MWEDKKFLKAREEFNKKSHKQRNTVVCVGWFSDKGAYVNDNNPQCHAGLLYWGNDAPYGAKPLAIFSGFQRDNYATGDKKAISQMWYDFQTSHPIWKIGILNTSFEDTYENGWVFDTNHPRNILCSAIFATRWPTEHPNQCRAMKTYIDAGMHPDMAFVLSTISYQEEGSSSISFYYRSGHMPCAEGTPAEFVKNFLSHSTKNSGDKYVDSPGYSGIDRVFCSSDCGVKGDSSPLSLRVKALVSGEDKFVKTKDIFYTEEVFNKEMAKSGKRAWEIKEKDLPKVVAGLNIYREEILS